MTDLQIVRMAMLAMPPIQKALVRCIVSILALGAALVKLSLKPKLVKPLR